MKISDAYGESGDFLYLKQTEKGIAETPFPVFPNITRSSMGKKNGS